MRRSGSTARLWVVSGAMLVALLAPPADAQSPEIVAAEDMYPAPPLRLSAGEEAARLERKRELLRQLEQDARARSRDDVARYTALLRQGLARIDQLLIDESLAAGNRSIGAEQYAVPSFRDLSGSPQPSDFTQQGQSAIEDAFIRPRVSHGQPVADRQILSTVALRGAGIGRCTGVLVDVGAVLTAAHCLCSGGRLRSMDGNVVFGSTDEGAGGTTLPIRGGRLLDRDFCTTPRQGRDLAVVFFAGRAPTRPALIMEPVQDYLARPSRDLVVVGFGRTELGTQGRKIMAPVPVRSRMCAARGDCRPGRELLLADPRGKQDTCPGDSGGPAYQVFDEASGVSWRLAGITSRGVRSTRNCGDGGIYSIVNRAVIRWLCDIGVKPGVRGAADGCGDFIAALPARLGTQTSPQAAPMALSQPKADDAIQSTAGSPPVGGRGAGAEYLQQCRSKCSTSRDWSCTEECVCRVACETQGDPAACRTFCAANP